MYGVNPSGWAKGEQFTEGFFMCWAFYSDFKRNFNNTNLLPLQNHSFEDIDIKWELWSWDGTGVNVSNNGYTGNKSIYIVDNSTTISKLAGLLVSAIPNRMYELRGRNYLLNGMRAMYMQYYDNELNLISQDYILNTICNSWRELVLTKRTPLNTSYINIWLYSAIAHTSAGYWDDIRLTDLGYKISINDEVDNIEQIVSIYPTPTNENININFYSISTTDTYIYIYDLSGLLIKEVFLGNVGLGKIAFDLTLKELSNGNYKCLLENGDQSIPFNILINK